MLYLTSRVLTVWTVRTTMNSSVIVCGWRRKSTSVLGIITGLGGPTTFFFFEFLGVYLLKLPGCAVLGLLLRSRGSLTAHVIISF